MGYGAPTIPTYQRICVFDILPECCRILECEANLVLGTVPEQRSCRVEYRREPRGFVSCQLNDNSPICRVSIVVAHQGVEGDQLRQIAHDRVILLMEPIKHGLAYSLKGVEMRLVPGTG